MIQKLIDYLYRYPISSWKNKQRFGGYWSHRTMIKGQSQMIKASQLLPPIPSFSKGLAVYFLTGKKYLYQTLFCAYSLVKSSTEKFQFILVDDGSFDELYIDQIKKQMPGVSIITAASIQSNLNQHLPENEYPYLHHKRKIYPHIKKLTDIHTIDPNTAKLVLDSDMLFWNEPSELINWLKAPQGCIYMLDCEESYGYDTSLMKSLCGFEIPKLVNVGAFGYNSSIINWRSIERWSKTLEEKQGASYFLEQALSAMLVANEKSIILNKEEYIVNPITNLDNSTGIKLHHYVDLSKKYYFNIAWRRIMNSI